MRAHHTQKRRRILAALSLALCLAWPPPMAAGRPPGTAAASVAFAAPAEWVAQPDETMAKADTPPTPTESPTPTLTESPTPAPTESPTPTPSPTESPTPEPTESLSPEPDPTAPPIPSPDPIAATSAPTVSPEDTPTLVASPTPDASAEPSPTLSPEVSAGPTFTPSPAPTVTPAVSLSPAEAAGNLEGILFATPTPTDPLAAAAMEGILSGGDVVFSDFDPIVIDGRTQTTTATWTIGDITDTRTAGEGWALVLTLAPVSQWSGNRKAAGSSLALASVTIDASPTVSSLDGFASAEPITVVQPGTALDTGEPITLVSCPAGASCGHYGVSPITVRLTVPASAFAQAYQACGTIALVSVR